MDLTLWTPLLFCACVCFCLTALPGLPKAACRATLAAFAALCYGRYFLWRITAGMPTHQGIVQHAWSDLFLGFETLYLLSNVLALFFLSRHRDRSPDADRAADSPLLRAPTDIFIATYNEGRDILERTIVGALAVPHPDLRVWVLDDGNRAWVREMAEDLGALYTFRVKGKHAKAGNINHGLEVALAEGRTPEFVLLLDADFVPHQNILERTLGLFDDARVGIVQTPQHFFNLDPIQTNLLSGAVWPDEQRFFFNVLLPAKDAWGAAFCCGTSAVLRVSALEACGGMATETVTEDMLTTFCMAEHGYTTVFLNERLSMGLAPEGLREYIAQRSRWCLGAIQQMFTRWSFAGKARIGWVHRLSFFDSVLHWVAGAAFRLMLLTAPMVYWWTGTAVIRASGADLIFWLLPAAFAGTFFMCRYGHMQLLPIVNDITQVLIAVPIVRTVAKGLVRPFGQPFKVTAKGLSSQGYTVQWGLVWSCALLSALSILGMVLRIGSFSHLHGASGYTLNVLWTLMDAAVLACAAMVGVEAPRRRRDERFAVKQPVTVRMGDALALPCTLLDISLGGARLRRPEGWKQLAGTCHLELESGRAVQFTVVRRGEQDLAISFGDSDAMRRAMILEIFTGRYNNDIAAIAPLRVFTRLMRALVAN